MNTGIKEFASLFLYFGIILVAIAVWLNKVAKRKRVQEELERVEEEGQRMIENNVKEMARQRYEEAMDLFQAFRKCGETLTHCGIEMVVVTHYSRHYHHDGTCHNVPVMTCEYTDSKGDLKYKAFQVEHLEMLRRENPTLPSINGVLAERIVDRFIEDISVRFGWKETWECVSEENKRKIRSRWMCYVLNELAEEDTTVVHTLWTKLCDTNRPQTGDLFLVRGDDGWMNEYVLIAEDGFNWWSWKDTKKGEDPYNGTRMSVGGFTEWLKVGHVNVS